MCSYARKESPMGLTVLSLNVWNGRWYKALQRYLEQQSREVDVFCFQGMCDTDAISVTEDLEGTKRANLMHELRDVLPDFQGYFAVERRLGDITASVSEPILFTFRTGIAMFTRRTLTTLSPPSDIFVFGEYNKPVRVENRYRTPTRPQPFLNASPRTLQHVVIEYGGEPYLIYNFHGLWDGGSKVDTDERLMQSQRVRKVLEGHPPYRKIFVGDFNLTVDAASLVMIEEACRFRNLVVEYGVWTTRSGLYRERNRDPYADYALVTEDVRIASFEVPKVAVSDHLPLIVRVV